MFVGKEFNKTIAQKKQGTTGVCVYNIKNIYMVPGVVNVKLIEQSVLMISGTETE